MEVKVAMKKFIRFISTKFQNFVKYFKQPVVNYHSFQDFFFCEKSINVLGHTFLPNQKNPPERWSKINGILIQVTNLMLLILLVISIILSIRSTQLYVVLENVLIFCALFVALLKVYIVFKVNLEELFKLIKKLDEHFPHSAADQFIYNVQGNFHDLRMMYIIYNIAYYTLIPQFCSMPLVFQIYAAYKSIDLEWDTILALNLGFNQLGPVVYVVIYVIETWFIIFSVYYILGSDLVYANLVQILSMEFDILGQMITEINFTNDEKAVKELKRLVDFHQELIEISEKLEEIFSPLLLINALASIAGLCSASFLSMTKINGFFIAKYFVFPMAVSLQIFVQCFFAQRLFDSSTSVATSAYNSQWYGSSVKIQRIIFLIIVRAQKAQTVTAWKFFDVSLETFQWIVSTSYSYFSILQGIYG